MNALSAKVSNLQERHDSLVAGRAKELRDLNNKYETEASKVQVLGVQVSDLNSKLVESEQKNAELANKNVCRQLSLIFK